MVHNYSFRKISIFVTITCILTTLFPIQGRQSQDYAANSILADGNWVKISTTDAGIYQITEDSLIAWGFSDPSKVKLFGYGGLVIDELFSDNDGYIDDLPQIPLWRQGNKLYFYSTGTTKWELDSYNQEFIHRLHPYSTHAYYFLTDKDIKEAQFPTISTSLPEGENTTPITVFNDYTVHEKELISVGKTGQNFFGEDFLSNPSQEFAFQLPGAQPSPLKIRVSFGAKISDSEGYIYISYNGTELPINTSNRITKYYDSHEFLRQATPLKTVAQAAEQSTIRLHYSSSGSTTCAYLDYIRLNYERKLQLYDGQVSFRFINRQNGDYYQIGQSTKSTIVWDITTPHAPKNITTFFENGICTFAPEDTQLREFIAFDTQQKFPSPSFVKQIENQNLHALDIADLTIITPAALQGPAERAAQLHRAEGLTATVVEQEKIFNEFSSGTPDATAYRRLMKMFYDRAENPDSRPRYLLLFGDGSYDNRKAMETLHTPECDMLLTYQSKTSIDERESFVLEDYFGFLEENSGIDIKVNKVCLGIGRIPVSSVQKAQSVVDKLYRYTQNTDFSPWKNNICVTADDGDEAIHTEQADKGSDTLLLKNTQNPRLGFRVNKIFIDSYYLDSKTKKSPEANRELKQQFDNGMLVFSFIGHNDPENGFTSEGLLSRYEMDNLSNSRLPLFITITCNYSQFDDNNEISAGENILLNPTGGAIGLITTTRVVYTDGNDKINRRLMKRLFDRNPDGTPLRIGDILKLAKRDFGNEIDKNKLNYILIGDPALKLTYPEHTIHVTRINGNSSEYETEMIPGESYTIEGEIRSFQNELLPDFNGEIYYSLYDEEKSITTLGNQDSKTWTYQCRPDLLATGKGSVQNGKFKTSVILPLENSHSGKSGLLNLYAYDETGREANGYTDKLLIGTSYETENKDTQGPQIEFAGINDESFVEGELYNNPATFICRFSDPSGIWTGNSLGRQMILLLDGCSIEENTLNYYNPIVNNDIPKGEFIYPLPQLSDGLHTLTFKVFDSLGNSSETTISFQIKDGNETYMISLEENPVTDYATLSCQSANGNEVTRLKQARISITDDLGEEIWTSISETNPFPLTWNLQDNNGERVPAGQYYCRGYFETTTGIIATPAKKIVVITQ